MSTTLIYDALMHSTFTRNYMIAFQHATGLQIELVPNDVVPGVLSSNRRGNAFCRLMAQFPGSCTACEQVHAQLQQQTANSLAPQTMSCFAGLAEFAVPMVVNGQHIATFLGGQVFQRKPTQAQFLRLAQQFHDWGLHGELNQAERLFFHNRVIAGTQIWAGVQLLVIFTKLLAEDINRNLLVAHVQDRPCITSAKSFILAHASEPVHLSDVAESLHVSTNYFSRFFKKAAGMGFSEFLARARVEIAKKSLADPVLPINEVASAAGFGSLSQFNRIFHRYTGCSPRAYRVSLLQDRSS